MGLLNNLFGKKKKETVAGFHFNKGITFGRLGRAEEAKEEFDLAIKVNPKDPDPHCNKGIALENLGRYEDAIKELDIAIKMNPNDGHTNATKFIALERLGRFNDVLTKQFITLTNTLQVDCVFDKEHTGCYTREQFAEDSNKSDVFNHLKRVVTKENIPDEARNFEFLYITKAAILHRGVILPELEYPNLR